MATLEHLTFSELEKLMRALALTEQEHLDNIQQEYLDDVRSLSGNRQSYRDGCSSFVGMNT